MIHAEPSRAKQTLRKRFNGVTDEIYDAAWAANVDAYPADPRVEELSVARAISFLGAVQGEKIPGVPKDYFDNSYADAALNSLK
jgi:NitT/TauT family transport system substrate-binding protein